jgi:transposase
MGTHRFWRSNRRGPWRNGSCRVSVECVLDLSQWPGGAGQRQEISIRLMTAWSKASFWTLRPNVGLRFLRAELPGILATPPDVLSPRMVRVIEGLAKDWRRLDERIGHLSGEITALARQDAGCERLVSVPGIGPIISSAMVAAIGTGEAFAKGRDFAAWLRLVPKQISTGDRTILGKISKRGNRYLRVLFVQAARDRADQATELGTSWAKALDRGGQKAAAPQCSCGRARQ